MKKFTLLEAQSRYYGGGNPFSNGHRSQNNGGFLFTTQIMIDLDRIYYDETGIKAIIEKKYKVESRLGNILTDNTFQKQILLSVCERLGAELYVEATLENKLYLITSANTYIEVQTSDFEYEFNQSELFQYNSDDVLYLEIRNGSPVAIVKRHDNIKVNNLLEMISQKLNIKIIKVDDTRGFIDFWIRDTRDNYVGRINNVEPREELNQIEQKRVTSEWISMYKKLGIF